MARASGWTIWTKIAKLLSLVVVSGVLAAGFLIPYVGGSGLLAVKAADKFNNTQCNGVNDDSPQQPTVFLAADGTTEIARFFAQNRTNIPFAQMPKVPVIDALVATEDKRFYSHHGVDLKGLIRAGLHTSNGDTQGGSTLTEQYVKQVDYYDAILKGDTAGARAAIDQNVDRKLSNAKCALALEKKYSKDQILEKYLNIAFFGENSYGIERAAQTYFGVAASKLTIAQGALLVGLVKAPTSYDPYLHPAQARQRRDLVIDNLAAQNYISAADAAAAKASPIKLPSTNPPLPALGCAYATKAIVNVGFFCDYAYNWLLTTGGLTANTLNTGGLRIVTTIEPKLQNQGQAAIAAMTPALDPANNYLLAMPSVKPTNGYVTSMITDKLYGNDPKDPRYTVNPIFTAAYAGSGSTYKYFTALAALEAGVDPNFTLTAPSPYKMRVCSDPSNRAYQPVNAGNYRQTLPLRLALPESSNTYFVAMEDQLFGCNLAPIVHTATGLGLNALLKKDSSGKTRAQEVIDGSSTTFTLGQESTSALELTGAFATLANGGVFCPPTPIKSITDSTGKAVAVKQLPCTRQYSPYVANTLVNIMVNDTASGYGTARSYFGSWYNNGGSLVAGKTGTNNASYQDGPQAGKDNDLNSGLWFIGMTPNLTSAAAIINPVQPTLAIANVPGVTGNNDGSDTFGANASRFWLAAYGPALSVQHWTWPTVADTPGVQVPFVQGYDPATATAQLTQAGFKPNILSNETCGSKVTTGNVAYYSPQIAQPGDVVNMCLSSGVPAYQAPVAPKTTAPATPPVGATPPAGAAPVVTPPAGQAPVVTPPAAKPPKPPGT